MYIFCLEYYSRDNKDMVADSFSTQPVISTPPPTTAASEEQTLTDMTSENPMHAGTALCN